MQKLSHQISAFLGRTSASAAANPTKGEGAAGKLGSHTATTIGQGQVPASAVAPSHQAVTRSASSLKGGSHSESQPISQRAVETLPGAPSSARPAPMTAEQLRETSRGISEGAKRLFSNTQKVVSPQQRDRQTRMFDEMLATHGAAFSPEEHAARQKTFEAADKTLTKLQKTVSDSDNKATTAKKGLDVDGAITKFAEKKEESKSALETSGQERERLLAELTDTVMTDGLRTNIDSQFLGDRLGLVAKRLVGGSTNDLAAWSKSVMEQDFLQAQGGEGQAHKVSEAMTRAVFDALRAREGGRSTESADAMARAEAIVAGATPEALREKLWG